MLFHNSYRVGARTFNFSVEKSNSVLDSNPNIRSYVDHIASRIVVRFEPDMSDDAKEELLFHELMHAIVKNSGLDQCLKEGFTEEFVVSALAPRIHQLLKDNFSQEKI